MWLPKGFIRVSAGGGPIAVPPRPPLLQLVDHFILPGTIALVELGSEGREVLRSLVERDDSDVVVVPPPGYPFGCSARIVGVEVAGRRCLAVLRAGPVCRISKAEVPMKATAEPEAEIPPEEDAAFDATWPNGFAMLGEAAEALLYSWFDDRTAAINYLDLHRHWRQRANLCLLLAEQAYALGARMLELTAHERVDEAARLFVSSTERATQALMQLQNRGLALSTL